MKRRKLLLYWTAYQALINVFVFLTLLVRIEQMDAAIIPPPWTDPTKNPCASMPGGWQLLYWPPLKKCFKIFTIGYPCPETMELSPTATTSGKLKSASRANMGGMAPVAECRCPPGTALSALTDKCHKIFERGPCEKGQYFSPMPDVVVGGQTKRLDNRWGSCKSPRQCPVGMIFWPKDGKCYTKFTKGPCAKGKLLVLNEEGLGECKCENEGELSEYFYELEETCHEHYTKGPCATPGELFLPGGQCDCHHELPHFYEQRQMCYELNTPGPCAPGNIFKTPEPVHNTSETQAFLATPRAQCQCKDGYVPWNDGLCYRLYTRGPCAANEFLINGTSCVRNFCGKSRLYFPDQKSCYRIGLQGPCAVNQVVVFDFTARPSVDGISYNGMCGCSGVITSLDQQCTNAIDSEVSAANTCESVPGMVELNGNCFKLYTRGPCGAGQWLEPLKTHITLAPHAISSKAKCVCRPGYTRADNADSTDVAAHRCNAPNVGLARPAVSVPVVLSGSLSSNCNHKQQFFAWKRDSTTGMRITALD